MRLAMIAALWLTATAAAGQDMPPWEEFVYTEEHDEGPGVVGVLRYRNIKGSVPGIVTIMTSRGPLVFVHDVTGCILEIPECDDRLQLIEAPDGLTTHPVEVTVREGDHAIILLMPAMF